MRVLRTEVNHQNGVETTGHVSRLST